MNDAAPLESVGGSRAVKLSAANEKYPEALSRARAAQWMEDYGIYWQVTVPAPG